MSRRKVAPGKYKSVKQKVKEGTYEPVDPFDYLLMAKLPPEGTTVGGILPLGATVADLAKKFDVPLDHVLVSGRLVSLKTAGYVVAINMARSDSSGWQITRAGAKRLAEWEKNHNHEKEGE